MFSFATNDTWKILLLQFFLLMTDISIILSHFCVEGQKIKEIILMDWWRAYPFKKCLIEFYYLWKIKWLYLEVSNNTQFNILAHYNNIKDYNWTLINIIIAKTIINMNWNIFFNIIISDYASPSLHILTQDLSLDLKFSSFYSRTT